MTLFTARRPAVQQTGLNDHRGPHRIDDVLVTGEIVGRLVHLGVAAPQSVQFTDRRRDVDHRAPNPSNIWQISSISAWREYVA